MHVAGLSLYDPSTVPDHKKKSKGHVLGFKDILEVVEKTLHLAPYTRRKLVRVPGDLDHPYWVEDENFDIEYHVRHIALPKPGDWRQLCILVARLHSRPLDMKRPLWEIYVIEGLDNLPGLPKGCFAIYTKTHHAAIDGATGADVQMLSHTLHPNDDPTPPPADYDWDSERTPSETEIILRTLFKNRLAGPASFKVAGKALAGLWNAGREIVSGEIERPHAAPKTRFDHMVSPHRVFDARAFDIEKFREMKKAVKGATINDVVITICGGAARKYLKSKGELPKETLIAMAPINVRTKDEAHSGGNVVSSMFPPIHTDISDPLKRLKAVRKGTKNSKELAHAVDARTMSEAFGLSPAALTSLGARLASSMHIAERMNNPGMNVTITNVPGPQIPLYYAGAHLLATFGMGPAADGQTLFLCVQSFSGVLTIAATACRKAMPDPEFFMDCLVESYRELKSATLGSDERSDMPVTQVTTKRSTSTKKAPAPKAKRKTATKKPARKKKVGAKTTARAAE